MATDRTDRPQPLRSLRAVRYLRRSLTSSSLRLPDRGEMKVDHRPGDNCQRTVVFLEKSAIDALIQALRAAGYQVIGPRVKEAAIVYEEVVAAKDLPLGWRDVQEPGKYRLQRTDDANYFAYNVGPHAWKRYLFPPQATVATAVHTAEGWRFETDIAPRRYAFLGVRACELAAIAIQDRVFLQGPYQDRSYAQRRQQAFIIAVNCTQAARTCFCTTMKTGPECQSGFDLAMTEVSDGFVMEVATERGRDIMRSVPTRPPTHTELDEAGSLQQRARDQMQGHARFDPEGIRERLLTQLEHPHWEQVAHRCLSCANCTLVCPTCFCHSVREVTDLSGDQVKREREWDSCFDRDFSYTGAGVVRDDIRSRYRQWLTHKFGSWWDQFETSGCVGCGRCITWCPVGIDVREELMAFESSGRAAESRSIPGTDVAHAEDTP